MINLDAVADLLDYEDAILTVHEVDPVTSLHDDTPLTWLEWLTRWEATT